MEGGEIMNRIMKGSLIVVSVLIIGLIVSLQGTLWAKATKTAVTGILYFSDFVVIDAGEVWVDDEGNTHTKKQVLEAPSSLTIGDDTIDLLERFEMNSVVDAEGNGNYHGWFIFFIPPEGYNPGDEIPTDAILFSGRYNGADDNFVFAGQFWAEGSGAFAGAKLRGTVAGTAVMQLDGYLLDPHGE
jgi:hypothetical protein